MKRVEDASRRAKRALFLYTLCDVAICVAWGISCILLADSSVYICAALPVALSLARIACAAAVTRTVLRVDRMAGATMRLRRIPYTSYHGAIGAWTFLGYFGSLAVCAANVVAVDVCLVVFGGIDELPFSICLFGTIACTVVWFRCTDLFYTREIDGRFSRDILSNSATANEWAKYSVQEHVKLWL